MQFGIYFLKSEQQQTDGICEPFMRQKIWKEILKMKKNSNQLKFSFRFKEPI